MPSLTALFCPITTSSRAHGLQGHQGRGNRRGGGGTLALSCLGPEVTGLTSIHKLLAHSLYMAPTYLQGLLGAVYVLFGKSPNLSTGSLTH